MLTIKMGGNGGNGWKWPFLGVFWELFSWYFSNRPETFQSCAEWSFTSVYVFFEGLDSFWT